MIRKEFFVSSWGYNKGLIIENIENDIDLIKVSVLSEDSITPVIVNIEHLKYALQKIIGG